MQLRSRVDAAQQLAFPGPAPHNPRQRNTWPWWRQGRQGQCLLFPQHFEHGGNVRGLFHAKFKGGTFCCISQRGNCRGRKYLVNTSSLFTGQLTKVIPSTQKLHEPHLSFLLSLRLSVQRFLHLPLLGSHVDARASRPIVCCWWLLTNSHVSDLLAAKQQYPHVEGGTRFLNLFFCFDTYVSFFGSLHDPRLYLIGLFLSGAHGSARCNVATSPPLPLDSYLSHLEPGF